jgi:3-oxoacid CoA-transferase
VRTFTSTARRNAINKVLPSAAEAIKDIKSDTTLLAGGFGLCGVPNSLINELHANRQVNLLLCRTTLESMARGWVYS